MIPSRLNLLSPEKKKHLHGMISLQFSKSAVEMVLFVISISSIAFLGSKLVLEEHLTDLNLAVASLQSQNPKTNQEILNLNKRLKKIEYIQKEYSPLVPHLVEIGNHIPSSVTLDRLEINQEEKSVLISGLAPTRDDLLMVKANLEKIEWLETIEIPLAQLTQKENIKFNWTLKIKSDAD
ncbi:MAG TPA: hypothetical protein VJB37_02450 [Patescibacteria group bacterium]|nr:hypothetical protein [Patescibacteria group bacterium]